MRRFLSFALAVVMCFCVMIATERKAMAMYVDPGSGLLALQSAASVVAAGAFLLRRKIRALFPSKHKAEETAPSRESEAESRKAA